DAEVSALPARIEVVRDECTLLDDGLSRNGSFVGEQRVDGRRRLRDGDTLRFGRTTVLFRRPGEGAPQATAPAAHAPTAAAARRPPPPPRPPSCPPSAAPSRTKPPSPLRRPTRRSPRSCTSASTRSRPTC